MPGLGYVGICVLLVGLQSVTTILENKLAIFKYVHNLSHSIYAPRWREVSTSDGQMDGQAFFFLALNYKNT